MGVALRRDPDVHASTLITACCPKLGITLSRSKDERPASLLADHLTSSGLHHFQDTFFSRPSILATMLRWRLSGLPPNFIGTFYHSIWQRDLDHRPLFHRFVAISCQQLLSTEARLVTTACLVLTEKSGGLKRRRRCWLKVQTHNQCLSQWPRIFIITSLEYFAQFDFSIKEHS